MPAMSPAETISPPPPAALVPLGLFVATVVFITLRGSALHKGGMYHYRWQNVHSVAHHIQWIHSHYLIFKWF